MLNKDHQKCWPGTFKSACVLFLTYFPNFSNLCNGSLTRPQTFSNEATSVHCLSGRLDPGRGKRPVAISPSKVHKPNFLALTD